MITQETIDKVNIEAAFKTVPALYEFLKAKKIENITQDLQVMYNHIDQRLIHIKAYDQREHLQRQLNLLDYHLKNMEAA